MPVSVSELSLENPICENSICEFASPHLGHNRLGEVSQQPPDDHGKAEDIDHPTDVDTA